MAENGTNLARCPICARATDARYRPFCSKRCAQIDLNRWFSGVYSVPVLDDENVPEAERDDG